MRSLKINQLSVSIFPNVEELARAAAQKASDHLTSWLETHEAASIILATGNSQLRFLRELAAIGKVDWKRVTVFHMDEYLGISGSHTASFRRYMKERVADPFGPREFNYLEGDAPEPISECDRYEALLRREPIALCCLGVGENGHLAFNDPPVAHFEEKRWVKIVKLDEACKRQQVNEGHFPNIESVPLYALTLTIPALMASARLICICPESRKAAAIRSMFQGPISTDCPASILRRQSHAELLLDEDSAATLSD